MLRKGSRTLSKTRHQLFPYHPGSPPTHGSKNLKANATLNVKGSSCSCLYPIQVSQVLSREWRWSWSSADRRDLYCRFDGLSCYMLIFPATHILKEIFQVCTYKKLSYICMMFLTVSFAIMIVISHNSYIMNGCLTHFQTDELWHRSEYFKSWLLGALVGLTMIHP